jgi:hypothetical protein
MVKCFLCLFVKETCPRRLIRLDREGNWPNGIASPLEGGVTLV